MNKSIKHIIDENSTPIKSLTPRLGNKGRLFITAFAQVLLVSANTYFISQLVWVGIAACGFGVSYIWTLNVKRISASSISERFAYATGAMLGGVTGVILSTLIIKR